MTETISLPPPVPVPTPQIPWKISGRVLPAPIGPLYKLGAALNAIAMLLLPAFYLAIIGGLGWVIYLHATNDTELLTGPRAGRNELFGYFLPMVVGGIVLVFMIKPLFARRPKRTEPMEITRAQQPRLFAFIDEICALVRAPQPRRVVVDLQVNASASFSREFGSLLRRDLTLTIGLPLATGLSVREFGGVLAHEFGHFAQGAGMRLTYVIRTINAWFARLVYERDSWDEFLRAASGKIDIRIGIIFYLARLMVWLTRKILWVFMWIGHGLSCFMLRQMEFDADHCETQVAGSDAFGKTSAALRVIGAGWQRAMGLQQESYTSRRLVNDLPGFVALETQRVSAEVREAMAKAAAESKTGWFDTHPSDADRVRAAERAKTAGVLVGDGPAATVFDDFAALAQQATTAYYQQECEIDLQQVKLLPLDAVVGEANALAESEKATRDFYHGLLTIRTLLVLSPGELHQTPSREHLATEWRAACQDQADALPRADGLREEMLAADRADQVTVQAEVLLQAGFKIKAGDFGLPQPTAQGVSTARADARLKITQRQAALGPALAATRGRLVAALRAYFLEPRPEKIPAETAGKIERLVRIVGRLEALPGSILNLRNLLSAFEILLRNNPKEGNDKFFNAARATGAAIAEETSRIAAAMAGLEYPFDHARGVVMLSDFLVEAENHGDVAIAAYLRGQALLDRLFTLYFRITGRLAQLALQAEQTVFAANDLALGNESQLC